MKNLREAAYGFASVVVGLLVVLLFSYATGLYSRILAVDIARATSTFEDFCKLLDYYGSCRAYLVYAWLFSRLAPSIVVAPLLVAMSLASVYLLAWMLLNSKELALIAVLLYASVPMVLSGSTDLNGLLYTSLLAPLTLFFLLTGAYTSGLRGAVFTIVGALLYTLLVFHTASPALTVAILAVLLYKYASGEAISRRNLALAVYTVLVNFAAISLGIVGLAEYIPYLASSTLSLAISIVLVVQRKVTTGYKLTAVLALIIALIVFVMVEFRYTGYKAVAISDPLVSLGVLGVLGAPSALLIARQKGTAPESLVAILVLATLPLMLLVDYAFPLVCAVASIAVAFAIKWLFDVTRSALAPGKPGISRVAGVIVVVLLLVASYVGSSTVALSAKLQSTPVADLAGYVSTDSAKALLWFLAEVEGDLSKLLKNTSVEGRVMILSSIPSVYWIGAVASRAGLRPYLIAVADSSMQSKVLLSKLLTSSEETALRMLESITSTLQVHDVYVVLLVPFSVRSVDGTVYVGIPREIAAQYGGTTYPVQVFEPAADLSAYLNLLTIANRSIGEYLGIVRSPELEKATSLAWTDKGTSTLFAQLVVKALEVQSQNKTVKNYMALTTGDLKSNIKYFELVYIKSTRIGEVSITYYGKYTIHLAVAVFKLREVW